MVKRRTTEFIRPVRLVDQDATLSRWRHGFEPRTGYSKTPAFTGVFVISMGFV